MAYRRLVCACAVAAAGVGLVACGETGDPYYHEISQDDYPKPNAALGEKLADHEIESAARITAIIEAHLHHLYAAGTIYRDAHPKADGCVEAMFNVASGLDASLSQGLFKKAASYQAILRFSNANEDRTRADTKGDGRGMAIKVFGLPEKPLTQDPDGPASQDFIMISHPTFLVADPTAYRTLIGYVDSKDKVTQFLSPILAALSLGPKGATNAIETTSLKIDNPLNTRYWSMVPYQLGIGPGAVAVKYSAEPCAPQPVILPQTTDPNYLRHAMVATLSLGGAGACMKFMIQPRTSPAMSVEDSRYEWPETEAPFHEVATITIPPQVFDTPEKNRACERLANSPWHALPEHKPLGAVNRMRKVIYERISAVRRASE
jgi:hypothetical protein